MTTNDTPSSLTATQTEASDPKAGRCAVATGSALYYARHAGVGMSGTVYYRIMKRCRWFFDQDVSGGCLNRFEAQRALDELNAPLQNKRSSDTSEASCL
jgi:hypothetical protein